MNITLSFVNDVTSVTLRYPAPVPPMLEYALMSNDGILWNDSPRLPQVEWNTETTDQGLTMSCALHGPFSMGTAIRWCKALERSLTRALAIYNKQAVPKDCPPYPVTFEWEGRQGLTLEQLEALHLQMPAKAYPLGAMVLSQPLLRVTDPCYQVSPRDASTLKAKPGQWNAQSVIGPTTWDTRVKVLQISHESLGEVAVLDYKTLEDTRLTAGVDSAQCGFFDDAQYPRTAAQFEYEDDTFYGQCCALTLDAGLPGGGVLASQIGAVTRSGFGDGGYDVYVQRNAQGEVVLAQLLFIDESAQDEEDADNQDDEAVSADA